MSSTSVSGRVPSSDRRTFQLRIAATTSATAVTPALIVQFMAAGSCVSQVMKKSPGSRCPTYGVNITCQSCPGRVVSQM